MKTETSPLVLKVTHHTGALYYWTGSILSAERADAYELTTPELLEAARRAEGYFNALLAPYCCNGPVYTAVIEA